LRFLLFFAGIALFCIFTSGVTWKESKRAWLFIMGFILFFSVLTFLTGRGGMEFYTTEHIFTKLTAQFTLFGWRPTLTITAEKTMYAINMLFRVFSITSMTILIPYSLDPCLYGVAFRGLGLPDKISYGMDLTMRFIPTFGRDFSLTMDAQKARGYEIEKIKGGLFAQIRKLAPLMVPVTIRAIAGSEDIIDAMDLRAFGIGPRTWIDKLYYNRRDKVLIGIGVAIFALSLAINLLGYGNFWIPQFLINLAH
jgi:energy-coupling factor transport system permease protein